ncbi:hypothetical protein Mal15_19260 [Stieleria maiorica]|uniref:DUF1257 domain-containing protein n=1 Tax=Stieleria maiorica TaxID=2795974 RepID=A0A5B9MD54_9BACT|nr:DUF1257 domain-containing protein [Stieleria maiorica]QEF97880.1 hypothetical protein Mal15_19260 [Stieleria maiorica]
MSHIVEIQTEIRDAAAVREGCNRLGLQPPSEGTFKLFSKTVSGLGVQLRDWRYPVVCELNTGKVQYDNYQGRWGDPKRLDEFMQAYAVERAKLEARKQGHSVREQQLADGSIKVTVQVGGAA